MIAATRSWTIQEDDQAENGDDHQQDQHATDSHAPIVIRGSVSPHMLQAGIDDRAKYMPQQIQ